jgi:hypothetical protein
MCDSDLFDATVHSGIAMGTCVMLENNDLVYAGPLCDARRPSPAGKMTLLHPDDFAQLKQHVDSRRH